jgi:pimeloyl-ACP methyl ester carboxylesterase
MKNRMTWLIALIALSAIALRAQTAQFVTVDKDVKLEVLDWGGTGRPMVLLTGLGNDAHVYDRFAPKFTANYHVYGITRRGYGASSKPAPTESNYTADRLGDDVLAVINALKLNRPILVGHSIAGEELSSIGSRHPEKVSGLIYLDAADAYGFYDRARGDWMLDMLDLKKRIDEVQAGAVLDRQFTQAMLTSVSQLEKSLQELTKQQALMPLPAPPPPPPIGLAIRFGEQKYTEIHVPILAIFACPHNFDRAFPGNSNPTAEAAIVANDLAHCSGRSSAFGAAMPSAQIVRLPNADHYVFNSNEADVLRAMNAFLANLP